MSNKFLFYEGKATAHTGIIPWAEEHPLGTIYYSPDWIPNWVIVIEVRKRKIWAKIALKNVPKQYRGLLLLLKD